MTCSVSFLDGPRAGSTYTFENRQEPPRFIPVDVDAGNDRYGNPCKRTVTYVRELSPFDDGPEWVYFVESDQETEDP